MMHYETEEERKDGVRDMGRSKSGREIRLKASASDQLQPRRGSWHYSFPS